MSESHRSPKGSVVAAFPATGKSFIADRDPRFADSDSSGFSWVEKGVRHPDWPTNYMRHIEALIDQGRHVLCSSHQEVRDALVAAQIPFTLVYPRNALRDEYITRMKERGSPDGLIKLVGDKWDEWLASCVRQTGCDHIVLPPGLYLSSVIYR